MALLGMFENPEPVEYLGTLLFCKAPSGITYTEPNGAVRLHIEPDSDISFFRRIFECIGKKIENDLFQCIPVRCKRFCPTDMHR